MVGGLLGHRLQSVRSVGVDDLGSEVDDHPGVVDELAHAGDERRAGTSGQQRRTGGHPDGMTEPVDRHPGPGQIPVADQADGPTPVQGVGQPPHHVRLGVADRLHPQPSPEGEEVGVRLRIEHLDHRGHREAAQAGPGSGEIPVAAVRQHHDRARLRLPPAQPGRLRHLHPGHDLVGSPARQGEHLGQRPQVRPQGRRHQRVVGRPARGDAQVVAQVGQVAAVGTGAERRPDRDRPTQQARRTAPDAWSSRPGRRRGRPGPASRSRGLDAGALAWR